MKTYIVKKQLLHDGKIYKVGESIDLDQELHDAFLEQDLIEEGEGTEASEGADLKNMAPVPGAGSDASDAYIKKLDDFNKNKIKALQDEIDLLNEVILEDNVTIVDLKEKIVKLDAENEALHGLQQKYSEAFQLLATDSEGKPLHNEDNKTIVLDVLKENSESSDNKIGLDTSAEEKNNDLAGSKD